MNSILDSELVLSRKSADADLPDRTYKFKLRDMNSMDLFKETGIYNIKSAKVISDTEMDWDDAKLVGSHEAIDALRFTMGIVDSKTVFDIFESVKEADFYFSRKYGLCEEDRTRLKMGIANAIFLTKGNFYEWANYIDIKDIEGGVSISYSNVCLMNDQRKLSQCIDIISTRDLNKEIFIETLKDAGLSLLYSYMHCYYIPHVGEKVLEDVQINFILRLFESEYPRRLERQRTKSARK